MNINKNKSTFSFTKSNITILFTLIYLIIFEFTWVTQTAIPKPSMLIESFLSLIAEYRLLNAFFETTEVLLPAIFIGILIIELFNKLILKAILSFRGIVNISSPFKYFSFFFFAIVFNNVFPSSLLAEFIFILLLVLGSLVSVLIKSTESVSEEYVETAKSLGLSNGEIISKVIWKSLKPKIYGNLIKIHYQLWIAVIIYEFIGAVNGIGSVYKITYEYNDLFAIISLGIFISLVVLLLNSILKFVVSKLVFWK